MIQSAKKVLPAVVFILLLGTTSLSAEHLPFPWEVHEAERETIVLRASDGRVIWVLDWIKARREPAGNATNLRRRPARRPRPADTLVNVGDLATFFGDYGVSGTATVISSRTIRLTGFNAAGTAPGMDLRIGLASDSRRDFRILEVLGRQSFSNASIDIVIPSDVTLDDFDTFTVWCFEFNVLITEGGFESP